MLDACARAGAVLGIGHERRYEPALEEVRGYASAGALGRLMHLDANVSHDIFRALDPTNWRLCRENAPAGAMTALGIHLGDMFVSLAGAPARVSARTARHVFAPPADDIVAVDIDFSERRRGRITCLSATPFYGRFTVYGDKGWVEVQEGGNVDKGQPSVLTFCGATAGEQTESYTADQHGAGEFRSLGGRDRRPRGIPLHAAELLANVQVLESVIRSAEAAAPRSPSRDGRQVRRQACRKTRKEFALDSMAASGGLTVAKAVVGMMTGSLAILSEAAHSPIDFAATVMTYFAVRASGKPADAEHHYGHGKIESMAALAETALLFLLSGVVIWEAGAGCWRWHRAVAGRRPGHSP